MNIVAHMFLPFALQILRKIFQFYFHVDNFMVFLFFSFYYFIYLFQFDKINNFSQLRFLWCSCYHVCRPHTRKVASPVRGASDLLSLLRSLSHTTYLIYAPISIFANPNNYSFKHSCLLVSRSHGERKKWKQDGLG